MRYASMPSRTPPPMTSTSASVKARPVALLGLRRASSSFRNRECRFAARPTELAAVSVGRGEAGTFG